VIRKINIYDPDGPDLVRYCGGSARDTEAVPMTTDESRKTLMTSQPQYSAQPFIHHPSERIAVTGPQTVGTGETIQRQSHLLNVCGNFAQNGSSTRMKKRGCDNLPLNEHPELDATPRELRRDIRPGSAIFT